tara:strand:- start:3375 stop:4043 length:669 start_codon:yes stop_codon:yes gene_type:complete
LYNTNKIDGILFDMDGTVLDSEGLFDAAQIKLLEEYNISITANELAEFKGMSYKDFYPQFMTKFNLNEDVDYIRSKLRTYLHHVMETELKYIDGFEDFYESFIKDSDIKVGLVTNTTRLTYEKIRSYINIDEYFPFVITVTEAIEPKPSPSPYLQAMDSLSLSFRNTIIIEDSKTGLISAVRSKATVLGITTSLTANAIQQIDKSINTASSYKEIKAYLENY